MDKLERKKIGKSDRVERKMTEGNKSLPSGLNPKLKLEKIQSEASMMRGTTLGRTSKLVHAIEEFKQDRLAHFMSNSTELISVWKSR